MMDLVIAFAFVATVLFPAILAMIHRSRSIKGE